MQKTVKVKITKDEFARAVAYALKNGLEELRDVYLMAELLPDPVAEGECCELGRYGRCSVHGDWGHTPKEEIDTQPLIEALELLNKTIDRALNRLQSK